MSSTKTQAEDVQFLLSRGWRELPKAGTLALWRWQHPSCPTALYTLRDAVSLVHGRNRQHATSATSLATSMQPVCKRLKAQASNQCYQ
jgi:hypothetical protein